MSFGQILTEIEDIKVKLTDIERVISSLMIYLGDLPRLMEAASNAENLFAKKVHELKLVDQKRDDIINALCQKIEKVAKELKQRSN